MSEEPGIEETPYGSSPGGLSRRAAIRLGLFLAGSSTIAWAEPSVATITLAHGNQFSPLCIEEDEKKDSDHGPDSKGGDQSDDSDSHDSSRECDDTDDSHDTH